MDDGQEIRRHRIVGPWLVTPDAVPPGAHGLRLQGRLNGRVMQGGVGAARKPPALMQPGDVFEVEIEGLGVLTNPVQDG